MEEGDTYVFVQCKYKPRRSYVADEVSCVIFSFGACKRLIQISHIDWAFCCGGCFRLHAIQTTIALRLVQRLAGKTKNCSALCVQRLAPVCLPTACVSCTIRGTDPGSYRQEQLAVCIWLFFLPMGALLVWILSLVREGTHLHEVWNGFGAHKKFDLLVDRCLEVENAHKLRRPVTGESRSENVHLDRGHISFIDS